MDQKQQVWNGYSNSLTHQLIPRTFRRGPLLFSDFFNQNFFHIVSGPLLALMPNFIQIGQKIQKLKIFSVGRFWLVGLVGRKMGVGISNSFFLVFAPLLAPMPNFIQIGQKTQVRNFHFWSILVGRAGRSKNGCRHFKLILSHFCSIFSPYAIFHPNRMKNTETRPLPCLNFIILKETAQGQ